MALPPPAHLFKIAVFIELEWKSQTWPPSPPLPQGAAPKKVHIKIQVWASAAAQGGSHS